MPTTSRLVSVASVAADAERRSVPMISGAAIIAHMLMCVRYSVAVMPPLPISSMSGSFQCPGPAYEESLLFIPMIDLSDGQLSLMSPVVRQRCPTSLPQVHGCDVPHSQIEKT